MEAITRLFTLIIVVVVFGFGMWGCNKTHEKSAIETLQNNGYTDITITGWRPFMKSDSDLFSTGFVAISPNGNTVSGAVCGGLLKGNTIRFD